MGIYQDRLFELQDKEYAVFQQKLTPTLDIGCFIGVRVPEVRNLAKELNKDDSRFEFLSELPHKYYDENMLHGALIALIKDYEECVKRVDEFLPFIDNWAVCDTMSPKVFKKHRAELLDKINMWVKSEKTYTCRFGIEMLMSHFLDEDFKAEYLEIPAAVKSEEYYVNMMIAWYYATALAKQWENSVKYIEEGRLDKWVHNKTIQKAVESNRISAEQKEYLRTLKIR